MLHDSSDYMYVLHDGSLIPVDVHSEWSKRNISLCGGGLTAKIHGGIELDNIQKNILFQGTVAPFQRNWLFDEELCYS